MEVEKSRAVEPERRPDGIGQELIGFYQERWNSGTFEAQEYEKKLKYVRDSFIYKREEILQVHGIQREVLVRKARCRPPRCKQLDGMKHNVNKVFTPKLQSTSSICYLKTANKQFYLCVTI